MAFSEHPDDNWTPGRFLFWCCVGLIVFGLTAAGINSLGLLWHTELDRRVVESSRQYAETNTDAFYRTLSAYKALDTQLADPATSDAVRAGIREQKTFYENEMRRQVAKIPSDARTLDMNRFGGF